MSLAKTRLYISTQRQWLVLLWIAFWVTVLVALALSCHD